LILRNSGLIVPKQTADKINKMGFKTPDIFKSAETLKTQWIKQHSNNDLSLKEEWREMQCVFEKLKLRSFKIDQTLAPSTEAIQARLKHAIDNLERKIVKAEKRNYDTRLTQIDHIKADLFPGGGLQERNENFGLFYVKFGQQLINDLIEKFEPLNFKFTVLTE